MFVHIYSINGGGGAAGGGGISLSTLFGVPGVGGRWSINVSGGLVPSESLSLLYDESESSLLLSNSIFGGRGGGVGALGN